MTRQWIALLCLVLLMEAKLPLSARAASSSARPQPSGEVLHQDDIDLDEPTADEEKAKRLNEHEPRHELSIDLEEDDAPARDWFTRAQMRHRSSNVGGGDGDPAARRRLHAAARRAMSRHHHDDDLDDSDYQLLRHPAGSLVRNDEGASRNSLWTRERANGQWDKRDRANKRLFQDIASAKRQDPDYWHAGRILDPAERINLRNSHIFELNQQRRQPSDYEIAKRRCETTPFINLKNPTYCDTHDFFGAQSYGKGEIWEQAGR